MRQERDPFLCAPEKALLEMRKISKMGELMEYTQQMFDVSKQQIYRVHNCWVAVGITNA